MYDQLKDVIIHTSGISLNEEFNIISDLTNNLPNVRNIVKLATNYYSITTAIEQNVNK